MRKALFLLVLLSAVGTAQAEDVSVAVIPERGFGYFVGDLVRARIEIRAGGDLRLSRASLPQAGPLTTALDLRAVEVEEAERAGERLWRIDLTYQNFYVALDVRDLVVPGFAVSLDGLAGRRVVDVPEWRFGVAPLREISPEHPERARDYMRPDSIPPHVGDAGPRNGALAFAAAAVAGLAAVARDRAWPPFHRRRARIFAALSRRFAAQARRPRDDRELREALQRLHRAIDAANGASVLSGDLAEFLRARPEFAPLRDSFETFFAASNRIFFGAGGATADFGMAELARFTAALAARERAS